MSTGTDKPLFVRTFSGHGEAVCLSPRTLSAGPWTARWQKDEDRATAD